MKSRNKWPLLIGIVLFLFSLATPAHANVYGGNRYWTAFGSKADISWTSTRPPSYQAAWVSTPAVWDEGLDDYGWWIQTGFHGNSGADPNSYVEYHYSDGSYDISELSSCPINWARNYEIRRASERLWSVYINGVFKLNGYVDNDNRKEMQALAESWYSMVGDTYIPFRNVQYQYYMFGSFSPFDQAHWLQEGGWSVSYDDYANYDAFGDD